ncbi:hormone-sensitive lipase [Prorops nasuta]|uniref:hormone-sensitive lipase n=1 Tax=Prorops nasuta TaxID=863751 RepID=UPI0034CEC5EA
MLPNDNSDDAFEHVEPVRWFGFEEMCTLCADYFKHHQDENSVRIRAALLSIIDQLQQLRPLYQEILDFAPLFDFDRETKGNGYRSFLVLTDKCIHHTETICEYIYSQKNSKFFRKSTYMREIEACSQLVASICTCLQHLKTLYVWSEEASDGRPCLFTPANHSPQELLEKAESINQYCFYGRCLGFQFCNGMRNILKTILVFMASFTEIFYSNGNLLGRCANALKYLVDPEVRARRIVDVSQHADVSFCQSFWLLNESDIARALPSMVMPSIAINQVISIPPEELELTTPDGSKISIPVPKSHIGIKPIHVRLLSAKRRIGMVGSGKATGELLGISDGLIIHTHGGGFVAQSSKSHEVYLRTWAIQLNIPILSIDYSLAPEAPYPRALEEIIYVYAWALKHCKTLLGSNAQKIIFAGDSAGANLNLGATLKCLELNIRKPDGIFMAYTPVILEFIPSPSRLLCLTDPLLPFGFMMRCLKAYAAVDTAKSSKTLDTESGGESPKSDTESFAEVSESDLIALALSPTEDESNEQKLASLPSDSTLNSVSLADIENIQSAELPKDEETSHEYIRKFLEKYRNSALGNLSTPNGSVGTDNDLSANIKTWSLFGWALGSTSKEMKELNIDGAKTPSEEFVFTVPKDPLLSPYLATDEALSRLPPIKILTMELDPCLDDCVMFGRKLKALGNDVSLDVLSGLPHGFFNLLMYSKEAYEGTLVAARRIEELLNL